jgi:hypothetical protein
LPYGSIFGGRAQLRAPYRRAPIDSVDAEKAIDLNHFVVLPSCSLRLVAPAFRDEQMLRLSRLWYIGFILIFGA